MAVCDEVIAAARRQSDNDPRRGASTPTSPHAPERFRPPATRLTGMEDGPSEGGTP